MSLATWKSPVTAGTMAPPKNRSSHVIAIQHQKFVVVAAPTAAKQARVAINMLYIVTRTGYFWYLDSGAAPHAIIIPTHNEPTHNERDEQIRWSSGPYDVCHA